MRYNPCEKCGEDCQRRKRCKVCKQLVGWCCGQPNPKTDWLADVCVECADRPRPAATPAPLNLPAGLVDLFAEMDRLAAAGAARRKAAQ